MHSSHRVCLLVISMIFILPTKGKTFIGNRRKVTCTTLSGEAGYCVPFGSCNDKYEIEPGGIIIESELRAKGECNADRSEWCCSEKNTNEDLTGLGQTGIVPPKKANKCVAHNDTYCPYLVKFYSDDDVVLCLGAMIGSKAILTTATCVTRLKSMPVVWARVQGSANPETKYNVIFKYQHPNYNSGSKLNDIALYATDVNVDWGSNGPGGACIDPDETPQGKCIAANVDDAYKMDMVNVYVEKGSCNNRGNVADAMCGTGDLQDLIHGAPIMCQKNHLFILEGITKMAYPNMPQKALLGRLDYTWLVDTLKTKMGLSDSDFLYDRNY